MDLPVRYVPLYIAWPSFASQRREITRCFGERDPLRLSFHLSIWNLTHSQNIQKGHFLIDPDNGGILENNLKTFANTRRPFITVHYNSSSPLVICPSTPLFFMLN